MAGVSLAMAFCIVFRKNLSFWSACSFEGKIFFSQGQPKAAEILCVFQRLRGFLWEKRFLQNRVNPYVSPPNAALFFFFIGSRFRGDWVLIQEKNGGDQTFFRRCRV